MTGHLIVTDEDATRVITLRRPEKKNAITQTMYRDMSEAIDTAQTNSAIRCIVIAGGSGAFTAGNDLEDFLKDEICALPAEAVAISRKLVRLPPEDLTRRIDQESQLFGERMRSKEAVAAFKAFFSRKKA
jgi:hypothetical protein